MKTFLALVALAFTFLILTFVAGALLKLAFPSTAHTGGIGLGFWPPPGGRNYLWLSLADWQAWPALILGAIFTVGVFRMSRRGYHQHRK